MDTADRFSHIPSNRFLGMRLLRRSTAVAEVELPLRPEFVQEEGVVQGGFVAALADIAAVYVLWPDLPPQRAMTSIEFKLNFLGPARPDAGPLRAVGTLLRQGRTIAVCESEVFQAGDRIAKGTFTYLLRERA